MKNVGYVALIREVRNAHTVLMLGNVSAKARIWRDKCILEDDNDTNRKFFRASFFKYEYTYRF
jgi:hypothetical protein